MALGPLRRLGRAAWEAAEARVNEERIRLAVTGLSRAGKTVFITSMVQNLLALAGGRDTLPALSRLLRDDRGTRLRRIGLMPAGAGALPRFAHARHLAALAGEAGAWPARTEDVSGLSLFLELDRRAGLSRSLGPRRIRLDILDYPGEWLLDLPLLEQSFPAWSAQMLERLRRPALAAVAAPFLAFADGLRADEPADEARLQRGHALYRSTLEAARGRLGLRYLQPGRLLCPGPRGEAPLLWFFPAVLAPGAAPAPGTAAGLLAERFGAYRRDMRTHVFGADWRAFDRQILLVDVLGALHAGQAAFEDTAEAVADICRGLRGPGAWFGLAQTAIPRVAVVATKADHVPALRREALGHLLRALTGPALGGARPGAVSHHVAAAVLSTVDAVGELGGRRVEMVEGVLLGEDRARRVFTGDVPAGLPDAAFWAGGFFELPVFRPPRIAASGREGVPQLGIDAVLAALLEDRL